MDKDHMGTWRVRRRYLFWNTLFNMAVIIYCLYKNNDTKIADTAVTMAFVALISSLGSYVFGAVWDDDNRMKRGAPIMRNRPDCNEPKD